MEFSRPESWSGQPLPSPGDLPNPGIESISPALQADALPAEPPGKPKNTGVGRLSFLQQIFLIQVLNQGLMHCRQILYQLSYQGSPYRTIRNTQNTGTNKEVQQGGRIQDQYAETSSILYAKSKQSENQLRKLFHLYFYHRE